MAVVRRSDAQAAQLLAAGKAIREQAGSIRALVDQPDFDRVSAEVAERLGEQAYTEAVAIGASLEFNAAVELGSRIIAQRLAEE